MRAIDHAIPERMSARTPDWDRVHVAGAMLGIALQPISTATGNIGLVIALACAAPSWRRLAAGGAQLWDRPWVRWLAAWVAWSWCSLLWSSDPWAGASQLKAVRVLTWIPVLWPLRRHWWLLVAALLTGTTLLQVLQAVQMRWGWPAADKFAQGSVWTSSTQTGLWDAVSISFWLMLAVLAGWRRALACLPMAVLSSTALVWSATRASVIAVAVELLVANAVLAWTSRTWLRRALLRCVMGAVILAGVSTFAKSQLQAKVSQAIREVRETIDAPTEVTTEYRIAMWRMAVHGWTQRPLLGVGVGGIQRSISAETPIRSPEHDLTKVGMVHSTYVQALAETGLVGACLLIGWIVVMMREALQRVAEQPIRVTAFGATLLWLIAAAFDGYQQSGGFLTVGAITAALACMPQAAAPVANQRS